MASDFSTLDGHQPGEQPQRLMNSKGPTHALTVGAFLLAVSSILVTRVLKQYSVAEALAIAAFICGLQQVVPQS